MKAIVIISLISSLGVSAEVPLTELAKRLHEMRGAVESAGAQLEEKRKSSQWELESLNQRKAELDAQVRKEELKSLQLEAKAKVLQSKVGGKSSLSATEKTDLLAWTTKLKSAIEDSPPFKKAERLRKWERVKTSIEEGRESSASLVSDLWKITEEEAELTKSNEFYIGELEIDGKRAQAEIARLGRVQLYFVAANGRSGRAFREKESWKLASASNTYEEDAIKRLVSKFKDRQLSGWYEVPGLSELSQRGTP